ncbi:MAG: hypothetical protein ACREDZ_08525 [Kiloniellales bacterium]
MTSRTFRFLFVALFGLALAVGPLGLSGSGLEMTAALAKNDGNGNGNGNGGGNGNGHGKGHGNGGFGGALSADDSGAGKGHGKSNGKAVGIAKAESAKKGAATADESVGQSLDKAWGQAKKDLRSMMAGLFGEESGKPSASQLGRLNGFMHASPRAVANASPNSAVGSVAQTYRDALAAHLGAAVEEPVVEEPVVEEPLVEEPLVEEPVEEEAALTSLEAAAKALVDAANKPLDPAVVAEVNAKLAELNPDEPAFEGLEDPTSEQAQSVAQDVADAAQSFEAEETDQGLGNNDVAEDEGEEDTSEEDTPVEGETDLAEQSSDETTLTQ